MRYGWGSADEKIRLVGILDGIEVAERGFGADGAAERLVAEADANRLDARDEEEWASTRVVVKALDQYDNTVPFVFEPYTIEVEGPARLIGPPQRALVGGASAFWVAGGRKRGGFAFRSLLHALNSRPSSNLKSNDDTVCV
jgi:beta-galactosidase